jgi:hypothetical protein
MKLKNYSSGMLVRLAFSVMIQSDAEILLIDEVLAVGDAAFQQKCADVFHEMRDSDRTVILVTHDMNAVEHYCHRAMLLHDGVAEVEGDPDEVARHYLRLNFERAPGEPGAREWGEEADVRLVEARIEGPDGKPASSVETGAELRLRAVFEAVREVNQPSFGFVFANADGIEVGGVGKDLSEAGPDRLEPGQRVMISGTIENPLAPGRYVVRCWVYRNHNYGDLVLHAPHVLDFVVYGRAASGVVSLEYNLEAEIEGGV